MSDHRLFESFLEAKVSLRIFDPQVDQDLFHHIFNFHIMNFRFFGIDGLAASITRLSESQLIALGIHLEVIDTEESM